MGVKDVHEYFEKLNLSDIQIHLALKILDIVVKALRHFFSHPTRLGKSYPESPDQIEVCRANINLLIKLLGNYDSQCAEFKKNFPLWEQTRKRSIKALDDTAKSMQGDRTICNIVSISSNSVAAAGGLAICAALFPFAAPIVAPLAIGGIVAAAAGGATSAVTSIADTVLVKNHLEEAKKICEIDKTVFKLMENWIAHTKELKKALEALIGFDIWVKMSKHLKVIKEEEDKFVNCSKLEKVIRPCVSLAILRNYRLRALGIELAADFITILIVMILFDHQTDSALQICKLGLGLLSGIKAGVKIDVSGVLAALRAEAAGAKLVPRALPQQIAVGALANVGIIIEVTINVLSSLDLASNDPCAESKTILDVSELMEDERKVLEKVYKAILKK